MEPLPKYLTLLFSNPKSSITFLLPAKEYFTYSASYLGHQVRRIVLGVYEPSERISILRWRMSGVRSR